MKETIKIKYIPINEIKPYPNNAKKHKVKWIEKSIKEFSFDQPIVVDKDMVIIKGHGRYEAAKQLEYKKVPVIVRDDLNKKQAAMSRLADNRTQQGGGFDQQSLIDEIDDLDLDLDILQEVGFNDGFFKKLGKEDLAFELDDMEFDETVKRNSDKIALSIVINKEQNEIWEEYKKKCGRKTDVKAFLHMLGELC